MTTSEHYHMQRIVGYTQVGRIDYSGKMVTYQLEPQAKMVKCPCCGSNNVISRGRETRLIRGIPITGTKLVFFNVNIPIVECRECGTVRQIDPGISEPKKRFTKAFAKAVILLVLGASMNYVATLLGVSWDLVNDIFHSYLKKKYTQDMFKGVLRIGIDETYIGKKRKFITVVLDLDTGEPIFVGEGKSEEALKPFWELLGKRKNNIVAAAIDMGAAYQKALRENIPNAAVVFDHFHVIKLMNERIDRLRRAVYKNASENDQAVIRGSRYLLLKNPENLAEKNNEKGRLEKLLALNTPLTKAYILKEDLRLVWEQASYAAGEACLTSWIGKAMSSGVKALVSLGNTVQKHAAGILNYYRHSITTASLESFNSKLKVMIGRARGYRNMDNFKRMILAIHEFSPARLFS